MDAKFSEQVQEVLRYSREEALRLGHNYIGIEHFMLGILRDEECTATRILSSLGIDLSFLRKSIESVIRNNATSAPTASGIALVK
ncbi:MAG: Clp protease N-terminal domain-containing protein, partial [Bacteroidota bacterium]